VVCAGAVVRAGAEKVLFLYNIIYDSDNNHITGEQPGWRQLAEDGLPLGRSQVTV
jgi:hypothetical protein